MSSTIGKSARNGRHSGSIPLGTNHTSAPKDDAPSTLEPEVNPTKPAGKQSQPAVLSPESQREFLDLMTQGASPLVVCRKLNLPMAAFWATLKRDEQFAAELQRVWDTLSLNVVAALYQAAIKGNGSAQQFWLKHRPPPQWAASPMESSAEDTLETLSDVELLDRARAEAPDLAAEIAARIASTGRRLASANLSRTGQSAVE